MLRRYLLITISLAAVAFLAGCSTPFSAEPTQQPPAATLVAPTEEAATGPVIEPAPVESIELIVLESFPIQMQVRARGQLPDGCTQLHETSVTQVGSTFNVEITSIREPDAVCTQALVPFDETVPLDIVGLTAGNYLVDVNGVSQAFILDVDNFIPPTDTPVEETLATATPEATATPSPFAIIEGVIWQDECEVVDGVPSAGCVATGDEFDPNGLFDETESPLSGVQVVLSSGACPGVETLVTLTVGDDGTFSFETLPPGDYCVSVDATDPVNSAVLTTGNWTTPPDTVSELQGQATFELVEGERVSAGFGWDFSGVSSADVINDPDCISLASFGGDVTIPDDTPVEAGGTFDKEWRFVNSGGCTWTPDYSVTFVSGVSMGITDTVSLPGIVRPGESIDVTVPMQAPDEEGTARSDWLMQDPNGNLMGMDGLIEETVWVQIEVVPAGSLASVTGFVWSDRCDPRGYVLGDELPAGCFRNDNGTLRGDSIFDDGEPTLAGVVISLGAGECGEADLLRSTTTDANGSYVLSNILPGTYCVYIDVFEETNFNFLLPGAFTFPEPNRAGQTVVLEAGDALSNVNFGWDFEEPSEE